MCTSAEYIFLSGVSEAFALAGSVRESPNGNSSRASTMQFDLFLSKSLPVNAGLIDNDDLSLIFQAIVAKILTDERPVFCFDVGIAGDSVDLQLTPPLPTFCQLISFHQ
jgi:hypothetical protein